MPTTPKPQKTQTLDEILGRAVQPIETADHERIRQAKRIIRESIDKADPQPKNDDPAIQALINSSLGWYRHNLYVILGLEEE